MKKQALSFLFSAVLLLTFASCDGASSAVSTIDGTAQDSTAETTDVTAVDFESMSFIERLTYNRSQISDDLAEYDYNGYEFRLGHLGRENAPTYIYNRDWLVEETTGDVLNDAIYERNRALEERFNIDLTFVTCPDNDYNNAVSSPIMAGDDAFDMLTLHPSHFGAMTLRGLFLCLSDLNIDFSKPWWIRESIENYSYEDQVYTAYGIGTTVSTMSDSPVVFFNKELASDLQIENLYDVVCAGNWTYEYASTLIKDTYRDLNGNGTVDEYDQFGLHFPRHQQSYRYVWTLGGKYIYNNDSGVPTLNLGSALMEKVFDTAKNLHSLEGVFITDDYAATVFLHGNTLLENGSLSFRNAALRDAEFDIGILPNFKLDASQEHYLTNGGGGPQAIPITCSDAERSAVLMTALNSESYKRVVPAFYEMNIKNKLTSDEDSAEMLDLIFSNVVYDGCRLYNETCISLLADYIGGNVGYSAFAAAREESLRTQIQSNVDNFTLLD